MCFKYIVYLQHHSIRPSPSQVFAQWLSARFFIATAYSHRVSSSSQCSRQILSKSPTKKKQNKKIPHQMQSLSLSPWQNPHPVKKLHNAPRDYLHITKTSSPFSSHKHKIPSFEAGRGSRVVEKLEISVQRFCSIFSVKLKSLGTCFQISMHVH